VVRVFRGCLRFDAVSGSIVLPFQQCRFGQYRTAEKSIAEKMGDGVESIPFLFGILFCTINKSDFDRSGNGFLAYYASNAPPFG